jgi:hypothetical protein
VGEISQARRNTQLRSPTKVPHNIHYANTTRDEVIALEQVGDPCGLAESPFVYLIPRFLEERWYVHPYLSTFGNHEFTWALNPII